MKKALASSLLTAALMAGAGALSAQNVVTGGGASSTTTVINYNTTFADLAGMTVKWTTTTGSGSGVWGCNATYCGVAQSGFALYGLKTDLTYFGLWTLTGSNLKGFALDAGAVDVSLPGNPDASAVFDRTNPSPGTPGSSYGHDYNYCGFIWVGICYVNTSDSWNTVATYIDPVHTPTDNTSADLWAGLGVTFGKTFNSSVTFELDADNVADYQDPGIPTDTNVTPEPATMSLLAMGLVGLTAARRRRRA